MCSHPPRVHHPLGYSLVVEVGDLLAQNEVFEQRGAVRVAAKRALVVSHHRESVEVAVAETGIELILETRDEGHAEQIVAERQKDVLRDLIDQQLLLEKGKDLGAFSEDAAAKVIAGTARSMGIDVVG